VSLPPQAEILSLGRRSRPARPHRRALLSVLAVSALLVVAGLGVVDHRVRLGESRRVERCVQAATSAVAFASARLESIVAYVRPVLDSAPGPVLRRRMLGLVSEAVAPTVPGVGRARRRCAASRVLVVHGGLRATRADCVRLLDRELGFLEQVEADGAHRLAAGTVRAGRCRP